MNLRIFGTCRRLLLLILIFWWPTFALAFVDPMDQPPPHSSLGKFYHDAEWAFFPIPIVKTSPAEGTTFGIMPVVTASGKEGELKTIIAPAGTYNDTTKYGGFVAFYLYPQPDTVFMFFGELAKRYAREATVRFDRFPKEGNAFIYQGGFSYRRYPFERFFGFGPETQPANETNFVSDRIVADITAGYRLISAFTIRQTLKFDRWDLRSHAKEDVADTLQTFAGNSEVVPAKALIERLELAYDTHQNPLTGHGNLVSLTFVGASAALGSDHSFYGYDFRTKWTRGLMNDRFVTVISGIFDQRFGNTIPFYFQSMLGGPETLRAFIERRFSGRHRMSIDLEERIELGNWIIANTATAISLDPFFSVGQVFNDFSEIKYRRLQPVAGFGIRGKAKPSVLGRLDFGFGREGMQIYATLDYPF
ncbi:MAG: hypothetical protein HY540_01820 [Deltaproteobacteria bacterium]|nr:hypothetical protein [Deltaproteobacteria bacterium]